MKTFKKITLALLLGAAVAVSCKQTEPTYTITADRVTISDVAANAPGAEVIVVKTDAPYWIVTTPDWIKADPTTGVGGGRETIVTLTIASNYRNETTETKPRSGMVKFSGGMTSLSVPVNQLGYTPHFDPSLGIGGIPNIDEFRDFVNAVNDGESIIRWMNAYGEIELQADLDLAEMSADWTPIGNVESTGTGNNSCKLKGNTFAGKFNGGGHTLKNFNVTKKVGDVAQGAAFGLFGGLENAVIKDLTVETNFNVSAVATDGLADIGVIAGAVDCSTIENVKVKGKITSTGTEGGMRLAIGGIAGSIFSRYDATEGVARDSYIKNCEVDAEVNIDCGGNAANGAGGAMYGGIVAFSTNVKDDSRIHIENCTNSGTMTVKLGRCSGICPTANYGTIIQGCTNNADQVNTIGDGRVGQICCNLAAASAVIDCVNNGDLTTTGSSTTAGALVALIGQDTAYIEGGTRIANTGTILGCNAKYLSLLCANTTKIDHASNVILSGKLGLYKADGNHEMYPVNSSNIMEYVGYIADDVKPKYTNITYVSEGPEPETPEKDGGITDLDPVNDTWD